MTLKLLITNWHVLKNSKKISLKLCSCDSENTPNNVDPITVELESNHWLKNCDEDLDVCLITMLPIFNQLISNGKKFFYRSIPINIFPSNKIIDDFSALEEIIFLGCPSAFQDPSNFNPIIRRGITATPIWRSYNNQPRFIIDAGVFPGSSGSPVFILNQGSYPTKDGITIGNRIYFIGLVAGTFIRKESENTNVYLGLGEVINSNAIKNFIEVTISGL